jgi:hypothetical protein
LESHALVNHGRAALAITQRFFDAAESRSSERRSHEDDCERAAVSRAAKLADVREQLWDASPIIREVTKTERLHHPTQTPERSRQPHNSTHMPTVVSQRLATAGAYNTRAPTGRSRASVGALASVHSLMS